MDVEIYRGSHKNLVLQVDPVADITGWTIEASVRAKQQDASPVLVTVTATLTTPGSGIFTLAFTDTATAGLEVGEYVWDCWRTNSGQGEILIPPSKLKILGSVRKP